MLQFGTPLTRGEMKQIKGGDACVVCYNGDGTFAGEFNCSSATDCMAQTFEVCPDPKCRCFNPN